MKRWVRVWMLLAALLAGASPRAVVAAMCCAAPLATPMAGHGKACACCHKTSVCVALSPLPCLGAPAPLTLRATHAADAPPAIVPALARFRVNLAQPARTWPDAPPPLPPRERYGGKFSCRAPPVSA